MCAIRCCEANIIVHEAEKYVQIGCISSNNYCEPLVLRSKILSPKLLNTRKLLMN